jgi:hypothetical protein
MQGGILSPGMGPSQNLAIDQWYGSSPLLRVPLPTSLATMPGPFHHADADRMFQAALPCGSTGAWLLSSAPIADRGDPTRGRPILLSADRRISLDHLADDRRLVESHPQPRGRSPA